MPAPRNGCQYLPLVAKDDESRSHSIVCVRSAGETMGWAGTHSRQSHRAQVAISPLPEMESAAHHPDELEPEHCSAHGPVAMAGLEHGHLPAEHEQRCEEDGEGGVGAAEAVDDSKPVGVVAGEVEGSAGDHVDDEEGGEADGVGVQAGLAERNGVLTGCAGTRGKGR